jgi:hypothetical protein
MPADSRRRSGGVLARLGAGQRGAVLRPLAWIVAATGAVCVALTLIVQTQGSTRIPPRLAMQRNWGHPDLEFAPSILLFVLATLACAWVGRRLLRLRL